MPFPGSPFRISLYALLLLSAGGIAWAEGNPPPITAGGFKLSPKLTLTQSYSDNIKAQNKNTEGDFISRAQPELKVTKAIRDHELTGELSADLAWHAEHSEENTRDYNATLSANLVGTRAFHIPVSLSYSRGHIARHKETGQRTPSEPTRTETSHAQGGFLYKPGRFRLKVMGGYTTNRYEDGYTDSDMGIYRSEQDHNTVTGFVKTHLAATDAVSPFLSFKMQKAEFLRAPHTGSGFSGTKRDYIASTFLAGLDFDTARFSGHLATGYNTLRYDNASLNDIDVLAFSGALAWTPTPRHTLRLRYDRLAQEDSMAQSAYTENTAAMQFGYEAYHNVMVRASAGLGYHNYESGREDTLYHGAIGVDYHLDERLSAQANLRSRHRESTQDDEAYQDNIIMLGVKGAL